MFYKRRLTKPIVHSATTVNLTSLAVGLSLPVIIAKRSAQYNNQKQIGYKYPTSAEQFSLWVILATNCRYKGNLRLLHGMAGILTFLKLTYYAYDRCLMIQCSANLPLDWDLKEELLKIYYTNIKPTI